MFFQEIPCIPLRLAARGSALEREKARAKARGLRESAWRARRAAHLQPRARVAARLPLVGPAAAGVRREHAAERDDDRVRIREDARVMRPVVLGGSRPRISIRTRISSNVSDSSSSSSSSRRRRIIT